VSLILYNLATEFINVSPRADLGGVCYRCSCSLELILRSN